MCVQHALAGCAKNKFMCVSDGSCITAEYRCNGISDCSDNSDESGCCEFAQKNKNDWQLMLCFISQHKWLQGERG